MNKIYEKCSLSENPQIFEGYYKNYPISDDILNRLSKNLGFSYELYKTLSLVDIKAAQSLIVHMSAQSKIPEVVFLIDTELGDIVDFSLEYERLPLLNSEFIHRVSSLAETSEEIELVDNYYTKEDTKASVIIKKKSPIIVEEMYMNSDSNIIEYEIGILLLNDELNSVSTRLVLYVEGQPLYLPASYYSATTTRFKRSTATTSEALEVLFLKIVDDLRGDYLESKMKEFHYKYRANKSILSSYEEYNSVLKTMRRIPTIIEDNSFLELLLSKYENFEKKYSRLEDKQSSYVWRCTALSDITVGSLVSITSRILTDLGAPAIEYYDIRDLLGAYVSTNRIAEDIAKEDTV